VRTSGTFQVRLKKCEHLFESGFVLNESVTDLASVQTLERATSDVY